MYKHLVVKTLGYPNVKFYQTTCIASLKSVRGSLKFGPDFGSGFFLLVPASIITTSPLKVCHLLDRGALWRPLNVCRLTINASIQ